MTVEGAALDRLLVEQQKTNELLRLLLEELQYIADIMKTETHV